LTLIRHWSLDALTQADARSGSGSGLSSFLNKNIALANSENIVITSTCTNTNTSQNIESISVNESHRLPKYNCQSQLATGDTEEHKGAQVKSSRPTKSRT
jgi:hypothetical protein